MVEVIVGLIVMFGGFILLSDVWADLADQERDRAGLGQSDAARRWD